MLIGLKKAYKEKKKSSPIFQEISVLTATEFPTLCCIKLFKNKNVFPTVKWHRNSAMHARNKIILLATCCPGSRQVLSLWASKPHFLSWKIHNTRSDPVTVTGDSQEAPQNND